MFSVTLDLQIKLNIYTVELMNLEEIHTFGIN